MSPAIRIKCVNAPSTWLWPLWRLCRFCWCDPLRGFKSSVLRAWCRFRWCWNWRKRFCIESFGFDEKSNCGHAMYVGIWSKSCRKISLTIGVSNNFAGCMHSMLRIFIKSLIVYIFLEISSMLEWPFENVSFERQLRYDNDDLVGVSGLIVEFSCTPFEVRTCIGIVCKRKTDTFQFILSFRREQNFCVCYLLSLLLLILLL